jgi:hypothetical protein
MKHTCTHILSHTCPYIYIAHIITHHHRKILFCFRAATHPKLLFFSLSSPTRAPKVRQHGDDVPSPAKASLSIDSDCVASPSAAADSKESPPAPATRTRTLSQRGTVPTITAWDISSQSSDEPLPGKGTINHTPRAPSTSTRLLGSTARQAAPYAATRTALPTVPCTHPPDALPLPLPPG